MAEGKKVLVAGASGLVGYAAMRHFAAEPGTEVVALSRRPPDGAHGARFLALDLGDEAACARLVPELADTTHLVYAALHERPNLVAGWREAEQIRINDRMLRNLLEPLDRVARGLRHVSLLQGTKAYGVHVRPLTVPAREGRSELREQANFYWQQESYLRAAQQGRPWHWTIFRPVLIVGRSLGSAMNVIPALGVYAALLREKGQPLDFPGGAPRVAEAVDADLLARAIAWGGEAAAAENEVFNVTNGDVFVWPNIWPAIAAALGMTAGEHRPLSLEKHLVEREADWDAIRAKYRLRAPDLKSFVGLSLQYADYTMGFGRTEPGPPAHVSTIKLRRAGFHEVMDTEDMFQKWFRVFQEQRLLPPL